MTEAKYRIDPEVKAKWVAALRSGEYTKTEGVLFRKAVDPEERSWYDDNQNLDKDCHCALGVLAEEAAKDGVVAIDLTAVTNERFGDMPDYRLVPSAIAEWAGFGEFDDGEAQVAKYNDQGRLVTFDQVADWVEENF